MEDISSIIKVTRIGELGTTLAAPCNEDGTFLRNVGSNKRHTDVTSQKKAFFET
jgi:hypothetical protein